MAKEKGVVLVDAQSHLHWIQNKQKQIRQAELDYDAKKDVAKEAKATLDALTGELLSFIDDLNNGQERMNFEKEKAD